MVRAEVEENLWHRKKHLLAISSLPGHARSSVWTFSAVHATWLTHTATTVTPEPLRKLISKTGGKRPFCASANFLDTSHICRVQENVRGWPSRRRASLLLGALNVTRLRHLQHAQHAPRAPAAVQLSIASSFTSRLLHPHLISPNLISASQRHVDKCSQRDAHHAFPDFVFQTFLLAIDSSTAEVSTTNRIIGNPSESSAPPPSSRGAASKLGLKFESRSRGNFAFASTRVGSCTCFLKPTAKISDRRYLHEMFLKIFRIPFEMLGESPGMERG
jgi:hypothetical protein